MFVKDGRELVDGSGAREGACVSVGGEAVSDAGEGLVKIVGIKRGVLFVQVGCPKGVECFHVFHVDGSDAGVVDVNMGNDEAAVTSRSRFEEDAGVVDALRHTLLLDEVLIVLSLPDATGIGATGHVPGDPDHVGEAVFVMGRERSIVVQPRWDAGVDKAPAVSKGWSRALIVGTADVNSMLEGAEFDGDLGYESGRGGGDACGVVILLILIIRTGL